MAQSSTPVMPLEVATVVRAAEAGEQKPVYLFAGESFETNRAAHALLEVLVPPPSRAFNLETYDGRTTPISRVIDSLRTPGFLAGIKVIWLRESTLFLSGEKRAEITRALFAAWNDGREQDAAEKLVTLAALAGWSQDQFAGTRWPALAKTRLREIFGEDVSIERIAQLEGIQAVCRARELAVSAYRDDSATLLDLLASGMPPRTVLLITATAVDARKRLFKRLREIGAVVTLTVARERSGALSRDSVEDLVRRTAQEFSKRLAPGVHELIVRRVGPDPAMLASELEKLCLYVGERPAITEDDVRAVFRDMGEAWIFDFTGALATRRLERAVVLLRSLLEQGEPPLRLLAMITREVRLLLVARECVEHALRGTWRPELQFNAFQARVLPQLDAETLQAFGKVHPFVLYRRLQDASRLQIRGLRDALISLSSLDRRLKSSRGDPNMLLEAFVIDWCRTRKAEQAERRLSGLPRS